MTVDMAHFTPDASFAGGMLIGVAAAMLVLLNGRIAGISGIVGGLVAAVFGFVDWLSIPKMTRAKRIGAIHGLGNVVVVGLFAASWLLRYDLPWVPPTSAIVLSGIAVSLALVTGWLGGELVDRLAVGVDEGAHVDAPSSLSDRPITERVHGGEHVHGRPVTVRR